VSWTCAGRALKGHRDEQTSERRLAGSKWTETGLVFTSSIGTALDERNVRRTFKDVLRAAELPDLRLHDLRHTTATTAVDAGRSPASCDGAAGTLSSEPNTRHVLTCSPRPPGGGGEAHGRCDWLSDWLSGGEWCSARRSRSRRFVRKSGEPNFRELEPRRRLLESSPRPSAGYVTMTASLRLHRAHREWQSASINQCARS